MNTISNLSLGRQRSVTPNAVTFLPGDFVNTRLHTEYLSATVLEAPDMATLVLRTYPQGAQPVDGTYDADYWYIVQGIDETDSEASTRQLNHRELIR